MTARFLKKPLTLAKVDVAYSVAHNVFMLFHILGWRHFFPVFVLALATWWDEAEIRNAVTLADFLKAYTDFLDHHTSDSGR